MGNICNYGGYIIIYHVPYSSTVLNKIQHISMILIKKNIILEHIENEETFGCNDVPEAIKTLLTKTRIDIKPAEPKPQ